MEKDSTSTVMVTNATLCVLGQIVVGVRGLQIDSNTGASEIDITCCRLTCLCNNSIQTPRILFQHDILNLKNQ